MNFEGKNNIPSSSDPKVEGTPEVYSVDISEAWDTQSELDIIKEHLHKLGVYRPGLVYCGFNATHIGKRTESKRQGKIYAVDEKTLFDIDSQGDSAWEYAKGYEHPAIAAYDPNNLVETYDHNPGSEFEVKEGAGPEFYLTINY